VGGRGSVENTMRHTSIAGTALLVLAFSGRNAPGQEQPAITFNKNFEGGALGKIEPQGTDRFRCHVEGQQDERGHNRLANWYYFRLDGVKDRDVTLTLTDFLGEYNDVPGSCAMNADTVPVYSDDGHHWHHFPAMDWDDVKKEATLHIRPARESIWIAHVPPYTAQRLRQLLTDVDKLPDVVTEIIGKTVQGRDLHLVTVTNPEVPDVRKRTVWLIARQHAWEAGTSYVLEGALRFIASDEPAARTWRDRVVFRFVPMMDPDGCAAGRERFNANGYDVNRHWDEVDLRRKVFLERMPEIWYVKKAILADAASRKIDLLLNLHNTETAEYLATQADDERTQVLLQAFFDRLTADTSFDPSDKKVRLVDKPANTTNYLSREGHFPAALMEQRIGLSKKLGRRPTVEDRLAFGKHLIAVMADTVWR
jgi:hypothetical protein